MSKPDQSLPAGGHSRELAALAEIRHTDVSPAIVYLLTWFFLGAIACVPLIEVALAQVNEDAGIRTASAHLSGIPEEVRETLAAMPAANVWRKITAFNRVALTGLSGFERSLENETFIGRSLRAPAQLLLTGWLGAGNERVYVGRDLWLFYRPDIEYVTNRGFLDPSSLRRRQLDTEVWSDPPEPDPRPAILRFARDLESRGITLILMPTPVKPTIHAERLAARYAGNTRALHNPSYERFVQSLTARGLRVFDPSAALATAREAGPQYLATDTHWRPEAMELVAAALAEFVSTHAALPEAPDPGYTIERHEVSNEGDTLRMLDLPPRTQLYPPESVWLRRVLQPDGSLWRSSRDADILLLGDSFTNIYSLESLGWGTSAGLAEQLSFQLRRPIDRLVQNDQGSFATRAMLRQDPSRLEGKRVVIYQFVVRELTFGDWKVLPIR